MVMRVPHVREQIRSVLRHDEERAGLQPALCRILIFVIGAGFLISPEPLWADSFYIGVLPLALTMAWRYRYRIDILAMPGMMKAASLLILWFGVCLGWDADAWAHPGHLALWLLNLVCTFFFVHLLYRILHGNPHWRQALVTTFLVCGFLNILLTCAALPFHWAAMWSGASFRLSGWAVTRHPILGAAVMGIVVLLSVMRALETARVRYWFLAFSGLAFIAFTGSRGPEIAIVLALIVSLGIGRPRVLLGAGVGVVLLVGFARVFDESLVHEVIRSQMARGDSYRFAIWMQSWHDIRQRLLLGHGPGYRLAWGLDVSFPHNLFLSTWLYAGAIGVGFLGAYLIAVVRRIFHASSRLEFAFGLGLVVEVLFNGLTDFGQVIRGPSLMWYVFWLPTLFAATSGASCSGRISARAGHRPS